MAINTQDLLSRLQPVPKLDLSGFFDDGNASMERQRLKLMREQFEETKRSNAEQAELRRISEAGEMTRARMQDERQRAQQEAQAQAELVKQKRAAHDDMFKYRDVGDYEGMEGAANRLNELGGLAERTGEDEHGLPTWHVELDAEKYKKEQAALEAQQAPGETNPYSGDETLKSSLSRLDALGYPGTDRGTLMPPAGIGSSDDLTPEQMARVTGGGSQQRAATDRAVAQPPLEVEADMGPPAAPGSQPASPEVPDYTDATDPAAVLRARVLARGQQEDYGPPAAPAGAAADDASPIKPEYRQAPPQGLDPLAALRPARLGPVAPDQADIMGGVPKNVIDTGAMNAQAQRRLGPVMASIEASMPAAYRDAAKSNNAAAAAAGLPVDKTIETALKLRAPADAAIAREREHEFDLAKEDAKALAARDKPLTRKEEQELVQKGNKRAEVTFTKRKIQDSVATFAIADEVERMLTSGDPLGQDRAVNLLGQLNAQSKQQSDADANRLTGLDRASLVSKVEQYIHQLTEGGFNDDVKKSMLAFVGSMRERNKKMAFDWYSGTLRQAHSNPDPLVGRGYSEFAEGALSPELRAQYDKENPPEVEPDAEPAAGATPASATVDDGDGNDFEDAVDEAAEAKGLDPDKWRAVMGPESKGDGNAKNPHSSASGIIQMVDEVAREYVNPRTGKKFANAAELRGLPREEQAPIAAEYLHNKGLTADSPQEDYDLAVAAPAFVGKSANRDAVVYPKGSDKHEANKPWQPKDGGDITVGSILDFYARNREGDGTAEKPANSKPAAGGQGAARKKLLEGL